MLFSRQYSYFAHWNFYLFILQKKNRSQKISIFIHWRRHRIDESRWQNWHWPMFGNKAVSFASTILAIRKKHHIQRKTLKIRYYSFPPFTLNQFFFVFFSVVKKEKPPYFLWQIANRFKKKKNIYTLSN